MLVHLLSAFTEEELDRINTLDELVTEQSQDDHFPYRGFSGMLVADSVAGSYSIVIGWQRGDQITGFAATNESLDRCCELILAGVGSLLGTDQIQ